MKMTVYEGKPDFLEGRTEKEIWVYDFLDSLGICYQSIDHEAAMTIADCKAVERILEVNICKNLFLCNRQKTKFYLLLLPGDKIFLTKELSAQIPTSRLSFAAGEDMEKYLNVTPGSATVMGLLFDTEKQVQLLIDEDILKEKEFGCHPCVNTSSVKFRTNELTDKILPALEREYITVKLGGERSGGI